MTKRGKRYSNAATSIEEDRFYSPREAIALVKSNATAKFDETVELHIRTGADPRHADQMIRGIALLPHGVGKQIRTLVFCQGDAMDTAREAGADLGRILGRRGLMPNPRTGTVVPPEDIAKAVEDAKKGRVEFRLDRSAIIHVAIGKASFSEEQLMDNLTLLVDNVIRSRPSGVKGQFVKSAFVTSTMGPSVNMDVAGVSELTVE